MKATVELIRTDVELLTTQVAEIAEDLNDLRGELHVEVDGLRQEMEARFEKLETTVVQGNAALMSAILQLAPR